MHTTVPVVTALYAPAAHAVQEAGDVAAPTAEYDPAAHAVQALAPTSVEYVPALHGMQKRVELKQ